MPFRVAVILSSVKMDSVIKIIGTCGAKFLKPLRRRGGVGDGTDDRRQHFPFAWVFFLYSQTLMSDLLPQCWSTNEETIKALSLLLASFSSTRNPSASLRNSPGNSQNFRLENSLCFLTYK